MKGARSVGLFGEEGDILDADFLEFYRLDLRQAIKESPVRVYGLAGNLPKSSRVFQEEIGGEDFSQEQQILSMIEFWVNTLVWAQTTDGQKGINKPVLFVPNHIKILEEKAKAVEEAWKIAMTPEEIRSFVYEGGFS